MPRAASAARARHLVAVAAVVAGTAAPAGEPRADLVLTGTSVYTVDAAQPWAQAVAVRNGLIVYVGDTVGAREWIGPATLVRRLPGRLVVPGFHDTHVHPVTGGLEMAECDVNDAEGRGAIVAAVAACAARDSLAPWIRGGGWQLPAFPDGSPSRALLDSLVPDRPAYLTSADVHSAWVNTRALAVAGVNRDTPDPPNGRIVRDASGEPAGTLREAAMALVARHIPPHTDAEYLAGLRRGLAMAARFGITALQEASADERILRAYAAAERRGELTARVIVSLTTDPAQGTAQVARLAALRTRYAGRLVRPVAAKIFEDGVIEGQTAALLAPYDDRPGYRGGLIVPPPLLDSLVHSLDSAGFKVHAHAIGDRAIRVTLDAFARQFGWDSAAGPRHIMAHIQLFDPADIPRLAEYGVVASFQPLWAYADSYIRELTEPRLGTVRSRWLYPIRSVVATGAVVAAGSDWPVSSMDPLAAMQVAVTRRAPEDSTGDAWIPEERVGLPTILRAYTMGGARADDQEDSTGSVTVGKWADLVVLDRNLFEIPAHRIHEARVLLTLLAGREVYRDPALGARGDGR